MFNRLDKKLKEKAAKKGLVKEYLDPDPEKRVKIENEDGELVEVINISFKMVCNAVEALRMALKSPYVALLDSVNDRIAKYDRHIVPLKDEPYIPPNMATNAQLNIIYFFKKSFYVLFKIQEYNEEIRDEKYENAGLEISGDAQALYDAGFGVEVRRKIKMGDVDLDRDSGDSGNDDSQDDDNEEEEEDPEYI